MAEKKSFIIHADMADVVDVLNDEQAGTLFKAALHFSCGEDDESGMDALTRGVWLMLRKQLQADAEKWETVCARRAKGGKRGGRPSEETQGNQETSTTQKDEAQEAQSETLRFPENLKVSEKPQGFLYDRRATCTHDTDTDTVTGTETETVTDTGTCTESTCVIPSSSTTTTVDTGAHARKKASSSSSSAPFMGVEEARARQDALDAVYDEAKRAGWRLSTAEMDTLTDFAADYTPEWTILAIKAAADNGKNTPAYVRGVLKAWKERGSPEDRPPKAREMPSGKVVREQQYEQREYKPSEDLPAWMREKLAQMTGKGGGDDG